MVTDSDRLVAGMAITVGVVTLASVVSLAVFFAIGGPFGSINDWLIGVSGVLTGLLAFLIGRRGMAGSVPAGIVASGAAIAGAAIVVVGSALVITRTTGFVLAGFVESLGFALVGLWLVALGRSMSSAPRWPRRLPVFGIGAGIVMAIGFVVIPGIAMGIDDMASVPGWLWVGFIGWLGIFVLYPIWAIWLGRALGRGDTASHNEPA
jgi:hypothetical protein